MRDYQADLRVPGDGAPIKLFTLGGVLVCDGYLRCVFGGRGPYMEFSGKQAVTENFHIPPDKLWKEKEPAVYYIEYRTPDDVKLYLQKRRVQYADYVPGRWYASPFSLMDENGTRLIEELSKKKERTQQMKLPGM